MPTDDSPVSIVEDLDPPSAPRKDKVEVRELLLGLLLLVAVVGWAVLQTAQQEGPAAQYRTAQQAEREGKWSEALSHYSAATGYPGAADGVTRVRRAIDGLQEQVVSARWYSQEGQWASALQSVQSARAIDRNFGNLASIEAEAKSHVYSQALLGAVVMREVDGLPALYYRSATEWVHLPGSDGLSKVLASDSGTRFVYDVPVQWCTPSPVTDSPSGRLLTPAERLKDRRLVAALFDETVPRFYPLNLDTTLYATYKIGQSGVWGLPGYRSVRGDQVGMFWSALPVEEPVGYQAFGSTTAATLRLPGPDWVALETIAGEAGGRLLLADLTGGVVHLYVSEPDGSNPRSLYSAGGGLEMIVASPNGRYVVITQRTPRTEHVHKESAVLLDLEGTQPPRMLVEAETTELSGSRTFLWVMAGFLSEGTLGGKVLVTHWTEDGTTLYIFDPGGSQEPQATATIPGAPKAGIQFKEVRSARDGVWPVAIWEMESDGAPPTGEVVATRLAPDTDVVTRTLTLQADSFIMPAGVRGNYVIWTAYKRAVNVDGSKSAVQPVTFYSLPLRDLDELRPQPTVFFSRTLPGPDQSRSVSGADSSVSLGPEMLAYIQGADLRARTYDGAVDVLLESGVVRFEGDNWYSRWPWP